MTSTFPLLVFDLDGTLAETAGDLVGLPPITLEEGRKMVGQGARALIQAGYEAGGRSIAGEPLEAQFRDFLAYYEDNIAVESHLFPGVVDALDRFGAAGWEFAVCTNKVEHPSIRLLTERGVARRFRAICGQDTFRVDGKAIAKPDPRHILLTIEKAGGRPERAVMVGDSKFDIAAAQAASVPVVAVDFGYTDEPAATFSPDRVISHFDQLWDAVAGLGRR